MVWGARCSPSASAVCCTQGHGLSGGDSARGGDTCLAGQRTSQRSSKMLSTKDWAADAAGFSPASPGPPRWARISSLSLVLQGRPRWSLQHRLGQLPESRVRIATPQDSWPGCHLQGSQQNRTARLPCWEHSHQSQPSGIWQRPGMGSTRLTMMSLRSPSCHEQETGYSVPDHSRGRRATWGLRSGGWGCTAIPSIEKPLASTSGVARRAGRAPV